MAIGDIGETVRAGSGVPDRSGSEGHLGVEFQQQMADNVGAAPVEESEEPGSWHDAVEYQPESITPAGTPRPSLGDRPEPGATPPGSPPGTRPPSVGERPMTSGTDMAPPRNILAEPGISSQLDKYGDPTSRAKLAQVNDVVREQYDLVKKAVDVGHQNRTFMNMTVGKPSTEQKITAANAGATVNHINDAVDQLRRSLAAAGSPEDLSKAISEYGKQSSMIGGSLGKTIMGARTLGVRQRSLRVAGGSLGTALVSSAVAGTAIGITSTRSSNSGGGSSPSGSGSGNTSPNPQ